MAKGETVKIKCDGCDRTGSVLVRGSKCLVVPPDGQEASCQCLEGFLHIQRLP